MRFIRSKLRVIVLGLGRTGKEIASAMLDQPDMELVSAFCRSGGEKAGLDLGEVLNKRPVGITVLETDALNGFLEEQLIDVAVDFTRPESAIQNLVTLCRHKTRAVIGTTGFSSAQLERIKTLADKHKNGVVYAPNITLGVNVLMMLSNIAAALLDGYDCTIVETHFKAKKDAPSGTAKKIAAELQNGLELRGAKDCEIATHSIRTGGVIGRHSVFVTGEFDEIEIRHESFSRKAFAAGALKAVREICGKTGYYEMADILDMKRVMHSYAERSASAALSAAMAGTSTS